MKISKESKPAAGKPDKWTKIRKRAGELALNHGKRPEEASRPELQRAKRELLDMRITSPRVRPVKTDR